MGQYAPEDYDGNVICTYLAVNHIGGQDNLDVVGRSIVAGRWGYVILTDVSFGYVQRKKTKNEIKEVVIPYEFIIPEYWDSKVHAIPYKDKNGKLQKPEFEVRDVGNWGPEYEKLTQDLFDELHKAILKYYEQKDFDEKQDKSLNRSGTLPKDTESKSAESSSKTDDEIKNKIIQTLSEKLKSGEITVEEFTKGVNALGK